jgi:hypothetical protein
MPKDLKNKAIDIKGKKYVLVSDRVLYFNEAYQSGSITTELVTPHDAQTIIIKATIRPDVSLPDRTFTAYSQATWDDGYINKTSALENAETSAIGRALGFMGIGVLESIASADEIHKATTYPSRPAYGARKPYPAEPKHRDVGKDSAEHDMGAPLEDFGQ